MTRFTSPKRTLASRVYSILKESEAPLTSKQISDETGSTVREVVGALRILDDAGYVIKVRGEKRCEWSVPGVGALPKSNPHTSERAECRVRIIRLMDKADRPMSKEEIAESIGVDIHMVSAILFNLRRDGKVRNNRNVDQWEMVR